MHRISMKNLFFSASLIFLVLICQAFKNPIAPPTMILAEANTARAENVQSVSETQSAKPEFVINISEYFQTSFLDLEEQVTNNLNQGVVLSVFDEEDIARLDALVIPLRFFIGKEKSVRQQIRLSQELSKEPFIQKALRYRQEHGRLAPGEFPEWLVESMQMNAKRVLFKMMAMMDNYDYGLDVDYLSLPMIDGGMFRDELTRSYESLFFILQETYKYDQLFYDYSGVATRGRLGRQLGIDGVELYNMWRELDKKGLVAEHEMAHINAQGNESTKNVKIWLEIPAGINVRQLVNSLDVSQNIKNKLESYLLSLQRGKRRDNNFIRRYEELRQGYREKLHSEYSIRVRSLMLDVTTRSQEDFNRFHARVDEWVREYRGFEKSLFEGIQDLYLVDDFFEMAYDFLIKRLETQKERFNGNIPLGQEFLFRLLEFSDNLPEWIYDISIYDIKYK